MFRAFSEYLFGRVQETSECETKEVNDWLVVNLPEQSQASTIPENDKEDKDSGALMALDMWLTAEEKRDLGYEDETGEETAVIPAPFMLACPRKVDKEEWYVPPLGKTNMKRKLGKANTIGKKTKMADGSKKNDAAFAVSKENDKKKSRRSASELSNKNKTKEPSAKVGLSKAPTDKKGPKMEWDKENEKKWARSFADVVKGETSSSEAESKKVDEDQQPCLLNALMEKGLVLSEKKRKEIAKILKARNAHKSQPAKKSVFVTVPVVQSTDWLEPLVAEQKSLQRATRVSKGQLERQNKTCAYNASCKKNRRKDALRFNPSRANNNRKACFH